MKKCPYCAEEILDDAIKCKHCGEWLDKVVADPKTMSVCWSFTKLRSHPNSSSDVITRLPEGTKVDIIDQSNDWYLVIVPNNDYKGWVLKDSLDKTENEHAQSGELANSKGSIQPIHSKPQTPPKSPQPRKINISGLIISILVILGFIGIFWGIGYIGETKNKYDPKEDQENVQRAHQRQRSIFDEKIETKYKELLKLNDQGYYSKAIDILNEFKRFNRMDYKDLKQLNTEITTKYNDLPSKEEIYDTGYAAGAAPAL